MTQATHAAPIAARLSRFRTLLAEYGVDAVLVTDRMDGYWLTGFSGEDGHILVTADEVVLLTDGRFDTQAEREAPWARKAMREGKMETLLAAEAGRLGLRTLGYWSSGLSMATFTAYRAALRDRSLVGGSRVVAMVELPSGGIGELRMCKDEHELAILRRSVAAAETAFMETVGLLRPGMTELDVSAELVYRMQKAGASEASFPPIVASGANAALAHYRPKSVPIDFSAGLLIDWGARLGEYCSDLTRVLLPARCPEDLAKVYTVVLEAQQAAIAAIAPGKPCAEVDAVARSIIEKAGYGERFGHGLGHGVGLNIHEGPRLSKHVEKELVLQPGMVVTVEPGIYLPEQLGVRIEDDVLVTLTGHEVLTGVPKQAGGLRLPG